jgi:anaerobic C4-dicarboxylate transporter
VSHDRRKNDETKIIDPYGIHASSHCACGHAVLPSGNPARSDSAIRRKNGGYAEEAQTITALDPMQMRRARGSVIVFIVAAVLVVALGLFSSFRPSYPVLADGQEAMEQLEKAPAILIVMLAAAGVNALPFGASPAATVKISLMNAGVVALISITGLVTTISSAVIGYLIAQAVSWGWIP